MANRKSKPTSFRARQWEGGKPLSFAWWDFATEEARREYQTCQIDSRRMSYRLDMKFDVLDDLVAGKLIAFGFRDGASLEEGPVLIPAHLFPRGGEDTAVVDWDLSTLRSSSFSFARIHVTKPQAGTRRGKRTSAAKSEQASAAAGIIHHAKSETLGFGAIKEDGPAASWGAAEGGDSVIGWIW